jgi:DNA repair protein RadD
MKFSLPTSTTSELFKTNLEKENFEKILEEFNDKYNIFRDPDKLEELFLLKNIEKLKEKEFRIFLLTHAFGNNKFKKFCSEIGETLISKNANNEDKKKFVEKICTFEWGDNKITKKFLECFDLEISPTTNKFIFEENIERIENIDNPYSSMFFYQNEIAYNAKRILSEPAGRTIIQIPTGGGKTKIAMEIVVDYFNEHSTSTVVWLAESPELLEQAVKEFKKIWKHRGNKTVTLNRMWGKNNLQSNIEGSKLIIAGLSKISKFFKKRGELKADFIIFDEAHHAPADTYADTLLDLGNPGKTKVLGLTATPARGEEDGTEKLAELFNSQPPIQINTHDKYLNPIKFLQNQGVLSKLRIDEEKIIKVPNLDIELSKSDIEKLSTNSEYTDKDLLIKIGQSHIRNIKILRKLLELIKLDKKILYFGPSVEQANMMYLLLINFKIKAGFIDANTSTEKRIELIKKFENKQIDCLLNYGIFVAGFDVPSIDTVFIARPTKSKNTLFQIMGRGMRGPIVNNGTEFCDIYHVQDKFLERFQNFDKLYESYGDYFEQY